MDDVLCGEAMKPRCPKDDCPGRCEEKPGDWWYCDQCQCWYPGAHLRAKGRLGKTEKKTATKSRAKKKKAATTDVNPPKTQQAAPKKVKPKPRPKGLRRPRL